MVLLSRRAFVAAGGALALAPVPASAAIPADPVRNGVDPRLLRRALDALERHRESIRLRDAIGIADFSAPSRLPRFHILDVASGAARSFLVAHGRGSDPAHRGWVERFSNQPGSLASSQGAYATGELYDGQHGRSRRLAGLDPGNDNAAARAIVIHGAWYVGEDMVRQHGKLGRSEGCFAFAKGDLDIVLDRLGPGRLLYADKLV